MNIKLITVGKIKEDYLLEAILEYKKRLTKFCNLNIIEVAAEKILDEACSQKYMAFEAERILSNIKQGAYVITLEIRGKEFSSPELAQKINELSSAGYNEIVFVIGGANGLHKSVSEVADLKLSFSKLTFANRIMRIILLEQLYRVFKINAGENYHR